MLEDLDKLQECADNEIQRKLSLRESLRNQCWHLDAELQHWSVTSGSNTVNFVTSLISGEDDESAPSSEEFAVAHLGLLYWTTCLHLYQNLCHLSICTPTTLPGRVEPRQYCRMILLLMPYFQQNNMGELIMNITIFPAITVMRFLQRNDEPGILSEERRMLLKAFRGKHKRQIVNLLGTWPWRTFNPSKG